MNQRNRYMVCPCHHLRIRLIACLLGTGGMLGLGCQGEVRPGNASKSGADHAAEQGQAERAQSRQAVEGREENQELASQDATTNEVAQAGPPATRKELETYIERFKSTDTWHFGERVPGELVGTWRTVKRRDAPIVFRVDGSYQQDFNGNPSEGVFAISDSGKVVAFSKWNGIGLGAHYQLDGRNLIGPHGSIPNERWQRTSRSAQQGIGNR
ncbi:MAG: hypothetical protein MK108_13555 [Mariniblastus sp.]|nr:hypothetical protein [Mariniblastus sp.]